MNRILRFLGFDDAAERTRQLRKRRRMMDDDGDDEQYEERPRVVERERMRRDPGEGIIYFKGLATDDDKLQLRDALLDGCIVLIDLGGITVDQKEAGLQFITFMSGVAFANKGEFLKLGPTLFSVAPRMGMVQTIIGAPAHGTRNDG